MYELLFLLSRVQFKTSFGLVAGVPSGAGLDKRGRGGITSAKSAGSAGPVGGGGICPEAEKVAICIHKNKLIKIIFFINQHLSKNKFKAFETYFSKFIPIIFVPNDFKAQLIFAKLQPGRQMTKKAFTAKTLTSTVFYFETF
jgi:hypothetical protein